MNIFFGILLNSIIPIFILISLGFLVDRKFNLDINTLTKINLYLFVPAFTFVNLVLTDVSVDLLLVILLAMSLLFINFSVGSILRRVLKLEFKTGKALENSIMFNNAGNIGIPLITLVFSNAPFIVDGTTPYLEVALSVQVMILLVQTLTLNTFGFINSGGDGMTFKKGAVRVLKMPTIYMIILAILLKFTPWDITVTPVWPSLLYLRSGLVSIVLLTLGAQLSKTKINFRFKIPYLAVFCRLLIAPAVAFVLINLFGFEGVMAQAIFISSSTPTAVNIVLIAVECKGDADFAVQSVTMSTLLSAITMTAVAYLAYVLF